MSRLHVLVAFLDLGGNVPPLLGASRRLVGRGHRVTVMSDPTQAAAAQSVGASHRPWRTAPHRTSDGPEGDIVKDWECRTPLGAFARVRDRVLTGPASAFAADVRAAHREDPVDVLVADGGLLGALVGGESLGLPTVVLWPNPYLLPTPGYPPAGFGLAPARGLPGRVRDGVLTEVHRAVWRSGLPPLQLARHELGLPPLRHVWEQWDHAARVLVLTCPELDFPARLPSNVRYVGPVLDDPAWAPQEVPPVPAGTAPLIAVGMSSTWMAHVPVLRRVVAAVERSGFRAVVTAGPAVPPGAIPSTTHVRVVPVASHTALFAMAAAVVTHAGHGTLVKALAADRPVLCIPLGRDQPDNAVRAAALGAAVVLRRSASVTAVAGGLERLLGDPRYRDAALRAGSVVRAGAASSALVDEIEAAAA